MKTSKKILVTKELMNVAPRFSKAIWRIKYCSDEYTSITSAKKRHNLLNCNYIITLLGPNDEVLEERNVNNANIDGYGRRYREL